MRDVTHLIENWQMCDGSHFQDDIPELNVPNGYYLRFPDNEPLPGLDPDAPPIIGLRPEIVPAYIGDVGGEHGKFGQSPPNPGGYNTVLKIHKWSAPFAFDLVQQVSGLEIGQRYQLRGYVFPDFYDGEGDPPNHDAYAAAAGLTVQGETEWYWQLPWDQWSIIDREFVATAETLELGIAGLAKWGLPGNTWWIHGIRLYALDEDPVAPPPPPPPPSSGYDYRPYLARIADALENIATSFSSGVPTPPTPEPVNVVPLSQRDPAWASLRLGQSSYTIGGAGCAMVSACMEATLVRPDLRPDELNAWLSANGGYTTGGLLYWAKVAEYVDGMDFVTYHKWHREPADMALVRAELAEGPAILQVDFHPGGALNTHFVLALREHEGDIEILDPWDGELKRLLAAYGLQTWDLPRAIYALVRFRITGETPPPPAPPSLPRFVRGAHAPPALHPTIGFEDLVNRLKYLGIEYYKILDNGAPENLHLLDALRSAGIQPLVRLYQGRQFPDRLPQALRDRMPVLKAHGVDYVEIGNEPNLPVEWQYDPTWQDPTHLAQVADVWWADAQVALAAGLRPAIYAMAPTERNRGTHEQYSSKMWIRGLLARLKALHGDEMQQLLRDGRVWLAVHTADFGRPFDYDPWAGGVDDMCLRGYEIPYEAVREAFGVEPITISTEGGVYSPSHLESMDFAVPYTEEQWGARLRAMFDYVDRETRLFAMCPWTLSDEGVADATWHGCGWYDRHGAPRSPVHALSV